MAVQKHGFFWEHELLVNVYRVDPYELKKVGHTSPFDGPAHLNRLTGIDMSIKTTGNSGTICLGDCLRIYEDVSSGKPYHMTVLHYKQDDATKTKNVMWITEIELTSSIQLMFGDLTREDISSLDTVIKAVPQKRSPTTEEHAAIYDTKKLLQARSGFITLNPKCNSTQSRLQCSISGFLKLVAKHPERVIAHSDTNNFRGANVSQSISSNRRVLRSANKVVDNNSDLTLAKASGTSGVRGERVSVQSTDVQPTVGVEKIMRVLIVNKPLAAESAPPSVNTHSADGNIPLITRFDESKLLGCRGFVNRSMSIFSHPHL